jgi:hypothetical protein
MEKSDHINSEEKQTLIAWLLESPTPSIRYLSLTQLAGKAETEAEVQSARRLISTTNPVKHIFEQQQPEGYWQKKQHHYSPKYRSSHWSMGLLCELGVDPQLPAMQTGAAFMLDKMEAEIIPLRNHKKTRLGCFWGNWLRYQLYCGNLADERVQTVIDYVNRDILRGSQCPYNNSLPCGWGVMRGLYGLALIPADQRDAQTQEAIQYGLKFMLEDYNLLEGSYPYVEKIHPLWSKISFPLFYQADILFVLRVAKELNALTYPQARAALDWLRSKRQQNGQWSGGSPYQKKTWPFMGKGDSLNGWISLHALNVLT